MPYPRHKPLSEEEMENVLSESIDESEMGNEPINISEMDRKRWEGHHSVCQTIRDIYHLTDNSEIRLKCRLAMSMTKSMHERLKWYKAKEVAK